MTISVLAVLRRRDNLRELFRQYWNCTLDAVEIEHLIPRLQRILNKVGRDALFETFRHYSGREIYREEFDKLAWLLAGNLPQLEAGRPVLEWSSQLAAEWVPVQVLRVFPGRDDFHNRGYQLSLLVLSGAPSGRIFQAFRRPSFLAALSRKIGFTRKYGRLPYMSGYQYMSLRFLVELQSSRSQAELVFTGIRGAGSLNSWNTALLKLRCRVVPCPQGYTHECHRCIVGSSRCAAATHRLDYAPGACLECGSPDAWFDPELSPAMCVECAKKKGWQTGVVNA